MRVRVLGSGAGGGFPQWNLYTNLITSGVPLARERLRALSVDRPAYVYRGSLVRGRRQS